MGLLILILLIVLIIFTFPAWPYSRGWGYGPMGLISLILVIFLVLLIAKVITLWNIEVDIDTNEDLKTIRIERKEDETQEY